MDRGILPCKVIVSCFMGSYQNYHVMVGKGDTAYLTFDKENVHVL